MTVLQPRHRIRILIQRRDAALWRVVRGVGVGDAGEVEEERLRADVRQQAVLTREERAFVRCLEAHHARTELVQQIGTNRGGYRECVEIRLDAREIGGLAGHYLTAISIELSVTLHLQR